MRKTREQRQAELQAKANELIQHLLDWTDETDKPNLTQMEDEILALREEMSRSMLESILSAQEATQPAEGGTCPTCGQPLRYKGRRSAQVESRIGAADLERGYYYCPHCQSGIFPPGSPAGVA
jgi:DNA repair exonuclease SbcCD ATPase subunit